jgi:hypothetical protein
LRANSALFNLPFSTATQPTRNRFASTTEIPSFPRLTSHKAFSLQHANTKHTQFLKQKIVNPQWSASIRRAITRTEIAMASRSAKMCVPWSITLTKSVLVKVSSRAYSVDILPTVYIAILSVMTPANKDWGTFSLFLRYVQ